MEQIQLCAIESHLQDSKPSRNFKFVKIPSFAIHKSNEFFTIVIYLSLNSVSRPNFLLFGHNSIVLEVKRYSRDQIRRCGLTGSRGGGLLPQMVRFSQQDLFQYKRFHRESTTQKVNWINQYNIFLPELQRLNYFSLQIRLFLQNQENCTILVLK